MMLLKKKFEIRLIRIVLFTPSFFLFCSSYLFIFLISLWNALTVFTLPSLIDSPTKNTPLYKIISEESAKSRTTPSFNLILINLITKVIPIFLSHQLSSIQTLTIKSFLKGPMHPIVTKKGVFQWNRKFCPSILLLRM